MSNAVEAERLLSLAEEKLQAVSKLKPEQTYNLACVMAVRNRAGECRELLENAEKAKTLPSADHLMTDKDLERDEFGQIRWGILESAGF
jgi:hypothetical protein